MRVGRRRRRREVDMVRVVKCEVLGESWWWGDLCVGVEKVRDEVRWWAFALVICSYRLPLLDHIKSDQPRGQAGVA